MFAHMYGRGLSVRKEWDRRGAKKGACVCACVRALRVRVCMCVGTHAHVCVCVCDIHKRLGTGPV